MNSHPESIKIECEENCGNSPKKILLKELSIASATNDIDFCMNWMRDDILWEIVGDKQIQGKDDFEHELNRMKDRKVQELRIHNIITHGNTASLNGTLILSDDKKIAFCNVYNFSGFGKNAKIKRITSYVIPLDEGAMSL